MQLTQLQDRLQKSEPPANGNHSQPQKTFPSIRPHRLLFQKIIAETPVYRPFEDERQKKYHG